MVIVEDILESIGFAPIELAMIHMSLSIASYLTSPSPPGYTRSKEVLARQQT
jgi:hypothetical protein